METQPNFPADYADIYQYHRHFPNELYLKNDHDSLGKKVKVDVHY